MATVAALITEARSILNLTVDLTEPITNIQLTEWANQFYRRIQAKIGTIPIVSTDYNQSAIVTLSSRTLFVNKARIFSIAGDRFHNMKILTLDELIEIDSNYEAATPGVPTHLARTGTFTVALYPPPSPVQTTVKVRILGQVFPADLTADDTPDVPLHIQDIFPHWMAYRGFKQLADKEASVEQLLIANQRLKELKSTADNYQRSPRWTVPINENV